MAPSSTIREYVAERGVALSRAAFLLTGDRHAAEDLVQETYVVMVRQWRRIDSDNPDPYVRRIMYSRFIDGWRRRHGVDEVCIPAQHDHSDRESRSVPDASGDTDDRIVLRDALLLLTPRQRAVLLLRFYEDMTEVQTAQAMGVSTSTVKSQTRVALQRLRELAPGVVAAFDPSAEEVLP